MLPSSSGILAEGRNKTNFSSNTVVTFIVFKGNAQFVENTTFGLWEKNDSSTQNVLQNTNERTCDYLRYVTFVICLR